MEPWQKALRDGAITGSIASVASSAVLALLSYVETGRPLAAVNATSHWIWGDRSFRRNGLTLRYTASGYAIHHLASIFWGVLCEVALADGKRPAADTRPVVRDAVLTTVAACVGDYVIAPRRLTPGVEARISPLSIGLFYGAFGAGLAAGMVLLERRARERGRR